MSDAVQIELIRSVPNLITAAIALSGAILGIVNRSKIQNVHEQLNSMLTERVKAANSEGRIQERSEQRAAERVSGPEIKP